MSRLGGLELFAQQLEIERNIDERARWGLISDARREGVNIGFEEGRINTLREAALKKRARGLSNATIADHLKISEIDLVRILTDSHSHVHGGSAETL